MQIEKIATFLLVGILLFNQSLPVYAKVSPNVVQCAGVEASIFPMWENTNDVVLDLYFENDKAKCVGMIYGISGTSNISATFKLERKGLFGWSTKKTWSTSSKGDSLSFYETCAVEKGYTYRLSVTAKVTTNGVTETVTSSVEGEY